MEAFQEFLCAHASGERIGIASAIHEVEVLALLVAAAWEDAVQRVGISRTQGALYSVSGTRIRSSVPATISDGRSGVKRRKSRRTASACTGGPSRRRLPV